MNIIKYCFGNITETTISTNLCQETKHPTKGASGFCAECLSNSSLLRNQICPKFTGSQFLGFPEAQTAIKHAAPQQRAFKLRAIQS